MTENELLEGCLKGKAKYQRELYYRFADSMMGVCMRYSKNQDDAQDILQDGFVTVFRKLDTYSAKGALGGWIRKIMVNTALMHFRKNKKHNLYVELDDASISLASDDDAISTISAEELMYKIQQLPDGYRMVFNLYAIEGFNHQEIGELLNISAGTSKSQFSRARGFLKKLIEEEKKAEKISGQAI